MHNDLSGITPLPSAAPGIGLWMVHPHVVDGARAVRCLPPDELQRAARIRPALQRQRFIAARTALRQLLAERLGCPPRALRLAAGPAGRPELVWPPGGPDFSLSHCDAGTLIGIAYGGRIGVDIESCEQEIDSLAIGRAVFCRDELELLEQCAAWGRKRLFFRLWTAKEAVLKLMGSGFSVDPTGLNVAAALAGTGMLRVGQGNGQALRLLGFAPAPLLVATLAFSAGVAR